MNRYDRVVLAIVGILTFKFCLLYIEYNTNKGKDTKKIKDYLISYSQCLLYQSQWKSLNVLNTGYSPVKNLNLSRIYLYLSRVYIRNVLNTGSPSYQEDSVKKVLVFTPFIQDTGESQELGLHPERLAKVNKIRKKKLSSF